MTEYASAGTLKITDVLLLRNFSSGEPAEEVGTAHARS